MFTKEELRIIEIALAQLPQGKQISAKLDALLSGYNNLLLKLDQDTGITDDDFYDSLNTEA